MINPDPISFHPYLKTVIWGGNRIHPYKGIESTADNIGESWEISALDGHESVVSEGEYKGYTLKRLTEEFGESLLGSSVMKKYGGVFPILVKLIDTKDNISVQVHPDDNLAFERHGCPGKTEMWYIIKTDENARIYAGLSRDLTPMEYEKAVEEDSLMELLTCYIPSPGDVYFLPAGTVHAIGAGNLMVEIQQSSDITYRIYDYGRRDKEGNTRDLHTELAKEAIVYSKNLECKKVVDYDESGVSTLVDCDHFSTLLINLNGNKKFSYDADAFTVLICTDGSARLHYSNGVKEIKAGDTLLLPAILTDFELEGKADILLTRP